MEFEASTAVWKGRGKDAVLGTSVINSKDGSKLVLVTTQSEVVEYCTQSRKCVNHWTFRPGSNNALRVAAVRNPVSQTYFGLRSDKKSKQAAQIEVLVSWKQSDLDINKWKTSPLTETCGVHGLFVHPQLSEDVVVVYNNGQFECYDDAASQVFDSSSVTSQTDDSTELDGKVVWASLASNHRNPARGSLLLSMLLQSKSESSQYELVIFRIGTKKERRDANSGATLLARHTLQQADTKNATVVSTTFHAENLSFSVVWSSGEWQMIYFAQDALSNSLEWSSTKKITTFSDDLSLADGSAPPQKKRKLSNAGVSSSHYVAGGIGAFTYLVVASSVAPQKLVAWDSKFGVRVATTEVQTSTENDSSVQLPANFGQMRSIISSLQGEVVVVSYEQAVFLFGVKNKHSTLASVLGVYSANAPVEAPALPNASVNWTKIAEKPVDADNWEANVCSEDAEEQQLVADLINPAVTSTKAQFIKKFDAAVSALTKDSKALSYRFLMAVARRCVESAELGLWAALKPLIQTKRLSARAIPSLLPVLMKYNQFELLELAIVSLTDIDERSLVRLLRFFIRKNEDAELQKYIKSKSKGKVAQVISPCERFVVALLSLPTNNVFLHHAIREFQLSEVLFLLAICKKYFFTLSNVDAESDKSDEAASQSIFQSIVKGDDAKKLFFTDLPTSAQFCSWICALIDGHIAQLVLTATKDAAVAKSMEQLDALVQRQLESCERYEGVQNVLGNFLSGVKLPRAHGIPEYSIEELSI
ncbi:hypothetical protein Poli38472_000174 [Pythium oligandrum]|uniref:Nucleolar protein 11 C-terminal domain-containing protein n=1 Tax=Pythium oligandrum TaxID=41045 RepID=A0A8K1CD58_PYTOL|nr:hypothetical protein Poli38472_000174 [Pythium oligandrum]|eukprot:TMW60132.1 hypothetical protein Poli38472_000174 [Pythium oligandrum]